MRIGKITGTVTATVKTESLSSNSLMIVDLTDADGKVVDPAIVALDTCGAGRGDTVLVAMGSAARVSAETSGLSVDAAIIAIVDTIDNGLAAPKSRSKRINSTSSKGKK